MAHLDQENEMLTLWRTPTPEQAGLYLCWCEELGWSLVNLHSDDAGHKLMASLQIYGPLPEPPAGES